MARLNTMYERNYRIIFSVSNIFSMSSVVGFLFSLICLYLAGANFVTGSGKEGLDMKGTKQEANTYEEMKSIDEGSALLRSKSEHQENAVRG